jgi:hypothetical protein
MANSRPDPSDDEIQRRVNKLFAPYNPIKRYKVTFAVNGGEDHSSVIVTARGRPHADPDDSANVVQFDNTVLEFREPIVRIDEVEGDR